MKNRVTITARTIDATSTYDPAKETPSSGSERRLIRRLHLVARRMLFLSLILPVALLNISAWLLFVVCEIGWVVAGYLSGRDKHSWLEWTERLLNWVEEISGRVTALNSPPNAEVSHGDRERQPDTHSTPKQP